MSFPIASRNPRHQEMYGQVLQTAHLFIFTVMQHLNKQYFRARVLVEAAETTTWQMSYELSLNYLLDTCLADKWGEIMHDKANNLPVQIPALLLCSGYETVGRGAVL